MRGPCARAPLTHHSEVNRFFPDLTAGNRPPGGLFVHSEREDGGPRKISPQHREMEDAKRQNGQGTPEEDFSEFGEVRVISRPAPDAEDRLRRLFTLLLGSSAVDGQVESEKDLPPDDQRNGDHVEAEA